MQRSGADAVIGLKITLEAMSAFAIKNNHKNQIIAEDTAIEYPKTHIIIRKD